jgi:hypothetical protein
VRGDACLQSGFFAQQRGQFALQSRQRVELGSR